MSAEQASDGERMLGGLLHAAHLAHPDDVPEIVARYAGLAGLRDPVIYLADLQEERLVPLPPRSGVMPPVDKLPIDSTVAGRVFRDARVRTVATDDGVQVLLPLLDGIERLGVLRVTAPADDERAAASADSRLGGQAAPIALVRARFLASAVAMLVVSKGAYSDTYSAVTRTRDMTIAAEMQWSLLPPRTFATDRLVISGLLEPAYEIAGDAFDYAVGGDSAYVSLFDAMGHTMGSGLIASTALSASRHARRRGVDLAGISAAVDAAVYDQFGGKRFITGVIAGLDTSTGTFSWVNRGHPAPLLVRDGRRIPAFEQKPSPPMGLQIGAEPTIWQTQLQPGDRVLLYTDGVVEARDSNGDFFTLDRFVDFVIRQEAAGLSVPETLRRLVRGILAHQGGRLQDDATVLLVEWGSDRSSQF